MKEGVIINIGILGTGSYVPDNIVTNDDLAKTVDTSDEWITSRTGIKERRISIDETTSELAAKAAIAAIESANLKAEDIELLIVATITPDTFTPSTACNVQKMIGAVNAVCFDINAACTGFVYGVTTALQYLKNGTYKNALVLGAEVLSKATDWEDRGTCVLFGDGSGAVVLGHKENADILATYAGSDGSKGDLLTCYALPIKGQEDENKKSLIRMEGREVYKFATNIFKVCIDKVLSKTDMPLEDVDHFVLHQANSRIIDSIVRKLKLDPSKFYKNMDRFGNTSSASIPIALDEMVKKNLIEDGQRVLLAGFGGGLTWASILMIW